MQTEKYNKLISVSKDLKDNNSCTVLAGCVAFNLDYEQGYRLLEKYSHRIKGKGLTVSECWRGYNSINKFLGFKNKFDIRRIYREEIKELADNKTMTVSNCTNYLNPRKSYIVFVNGHAVGVKDNIVHDWTQGRRHRVEHIFEVTDTQRRAKAKKKEKVFSMGGFGGILDTL